MATLEEAVRAKLLADTAVAALVGTRVYSNVAPARATLPRIVYEEADRQTVKTLTGVVKLNAYDMSIECHAADYATSKALGKAVTAALDGAAWLDETNHVRVRGAFHVTEDEEFLESLDGREDGYYQWGVTVRLWYSTTDN